jgi:hypothetical protein
VVGSDDNRWAVDSEEYADGSAVGSTVGSAVSPGIVGDIDQLGSDRPVGGKDGYDDKKDGNDEDG